MEEKPKTAFEVAMERLNAEDRDSGVAQAAQLTDAQKAEIAELRKLHGAKLAESEILFRDALKNTFDPNLAAKLEDEFQIDRQRLDNDLESKIEKVRRGGR